MNDPRVADHAKILVNYCCEIKRGDFVVILGTELALPLIVGLVSEIGKVGARSLVLYSNPSIERASMLASDDETLGTIAPQTLKLIEESDAFIQIESLPNSQELSDVPSKKIRLQAKSRAPLFNIIESKRWNITAHPTQSLAQDAKMSIEAYTDFLYSAVVRDWRKMDSEMRVLHDAFLKAKKVRIIGKETDISFSVEGRKPIIDAAKNNLPGGEVYISPVESTVNGKVYFDLPINYYMQDIKGARLEFKNGEVAGAGAEEGSALLKEMLAMDEGARRLGELGIGMNRGIDRFTKNVLFDEKMGDTIHIAVGQSFKESGGLNESGIHIDMIKNMKEAGEIYFDEAPIYKDGKFAWE
jgi:aminopeptidase